MTLQLLAVLALGLMCGSELNVAALAHPTLNRQPQEVHTLVRSSFAALFGHVMPFWMAGSTLLNLLLLLPVGHLNTAAWHLAAMLLPSRSALSCFLLSVRCPSTTGLPNGRRNPFLTTGERRSIAGICTTS